MSNERCIKQLEVGCVVQGSKERRNTSAPMDRKFYILSVGWHTDACLGAEPRRRIALAKDIGVLKFRKILQNLLYGVNGWRDAALNRMVYRV